MKLTGFILSYVAIGLVAALIALRRHLSTSGRGRAGTAGRRRGDPHAAPGIIPAGAVLDGLLMVVLWPLLGPLTWLEPNPPAPAPRGPAASDGFDEPPSGTGLDAEIAAAEAQLAALDALLTRPELGLAAARRALAEADERLGPPGGDGPVGADRALAIVAHAQATRRLGALERLDQRRARLREDLDRARRLREAQRVDAEMSRAVAALERHGDALALELAVELECAAAIETARAARA